MIDPAVDVSVLGRLSSDVELIHRPGQLLCICNFLSMLMPVEAGVGEEFGETGLGSDGDVDIDGV